MSTALACATAWMCCCEMSPGTRRGGRGAVALVGQSAGAWPSVVDEVNSADTTGPEGLRRSWLLQLIQGTGWGRAAGAMESGDALFPGGRGPTETLC